MPFVTGFLRVRRRHRPGGPVDPDYGIEEGEHPEISPPEEGGGGDEEIGGGPVLPNPPPGIWPPLTPEHPWRPVDPGWGQGRPPTAGQPLPRPPGGPPQVGGGPAQPPGLPGQGLPGEPPVVGGGPALPPGMIWPPLPPGVSGHYLALVLIAGMPGGPKYRYVVVDAGLRPDQGLPGRPRPPRPDQGLPPEHGHPDQGLPPTAEPRRTG